MALGLPRLPHDLPADFTTSMCGAMDVHVRQTVRDSLQLGGREGVGAEECAFRPGRAVERKQDASGGRGVRRPMNMGGKGGRRQAGEADMIGEHIAFNGDGS